MSKLKMHSPDLVAENLAWVAERFPGCITEARNEAGELVRAVDFDQLRQELSTEVVEGPQERYHLNWPGKREALLAANAPIAKTLRPCREESVDFGTTRNLFIEGDNLEALKLLLETYLNRVALIYIDPPYNTGNEFIYDDNFCESADEYFLRSGQWAEDSQKLVANPESNGRFHSDWLSMIMPRLRLARSLLRDNGVLCVSIDESEVANLISVCDEIFGYGSRIGVVSRGTGTRMGAGSRGLAKSLDYLVLYGRSESSHLRGLPMTREELALYDQEDERGRYLTRSLRRTGGENRREDRPSMYYAVQDPDGNDVYPIAPEGFESRWVCGPKTYKALVKENMIEWKWVERSGTARWQVYQKHYLTDATKHPANFWMKEEGNKKATRDLNAIFDGRKVFDHPKPVGLLKKLIALATTPESADIVLDFFAGSGTTAEAVLEQNNEDGGNRQWILVQLPEPLLDDLRTHQVARGLCEELGLPPTIAEIAKERLRRVASSDDAVSLDGMAGDRGFRVLRVDSSNMKEVYYRPDKATPGLLRDHVDNIKDDRSDEDLLFQVLLDWGVDLSLPITKEEVSGMEVFFVDTNALAACFGDGIDEAFVKELAKREPLRAVFRDAGYGGDDVKVNVEQIFKQLSPSTEVKTI